MSGKKTASKKPGGSRGGPNASGKKPTPATGGGRSRRERRQALAEAKRQKALAEMVRAGESSRGLFATLRKPGTKTVLPPWIDEEVTATEAQTPPGEAPLVLFKLKDKPLGDALVVMRLSQMQRHFSMRLDQLREPDEPADGEGG